MDSGCAVPTLLSVPMQQALNSFMWETRIQALLSRGWPSVNTDANGFLQLRRTVTSLWYWFKWESAIGGKIPFKEKRVNEVKRQLAGRLKSWKPDRPEGFQLTWHFDLKFNWKNKANLNKLNINNSVLNCLKLKEWMSTVARVLKQTPPMLKNDKVVHYVVGPRKNVCQLSANNISDFCSICLNCIVIAVQCFLRRLTYVIFIVHHSEIYSIVRYFLGVTF